MYKIFKYLIFLVLPIVLSSCFELIEDITLNQKGSGQYKLTLNLSASTTRVNSVMAMDSIDGKKLPTRDELEIELQEYLKKLDSKKGISSVNGSLNTNNWIIKIDLAFESLNKLQAGLFEEIKEIKKQKTKNNKKKLKLI